ncbi:gene transfer agent family protein [Sphingomonas sp.]|uniref:gene transfer agent family protein n=1 Tax=Sphingomonas sp. TaxID=28214 RepID=UPI003B3A5CF1
MQTWAAFPFANGTYKFALGLEQIKEIERAAGAGLGAIYARTSKGRYGFADGEIFPDLAEYRFPELVEVIRQALIGGGEGMVDGEDVKVSAVRANDLVQAYLIGISDQRMAMTQIWALAYAILHALVHGYSPPKKGKPAAGPATPKKSSTGQRRSPTAP